MCYDGLISSNRHWNNKFVKEFGIYASIHWTHLQVLPTRTIQWHMHTIKHILGKNHIFGLHYTKLNRQPFFFSLTYLGNSVVSTEYTNWRQTPSALTKHDSHSVTLFTFWLRLWECKNETGNFLFSAKHSSFNQMEQITWNKLNQILCRIFKRVLTFSCYLRQIAKYQLFSNNSRNFSYVWRICTLKLHVCVWIRAVVKRSRNTNIDAIAAFPSHDRQTIKFIFA